MITRLNVIKLSMFVLITACMLCGYAFASGESIKIIESKNASAREKLAAQEVMRYVYLRTGKLPEIISSDKGVQGQAIVVARKDRSLVSSLADASTKARISKLAPEQYILKSISGPRGSNIILIVGGDDLGTLYGAYRYAESLGVRFYLHGDVIPDRKISSAFLKLDETGKSLFSIRGIQPFHDFLEGPDWWNTDDYKTYVHQLAKMRMNFIGLHNYPAIEPGVWVGLPGEFDDKGNVKFSYPTSYATTARNGWGNLPMKTSEYSGGAADLFAGDDYGSDVHAGMMPSPKTPDEYNTLFNRTAEMYRDAFSLARSLGVKTCIGTETPLAIPQSVIDRLVLQGRDINDPETKRLVYKGVFERISKAFPVDYFWLWLTEAWTWSGNTPEEYEAVAKDVQAAVDASKSPGIPFTLATCGWVLGPVQDRAALDKLLPKESPMSCISRSVGHEPVEPGFANISGRPKWAIPWMENDPSMTAPQPWVGRMRYDAVEALNLGCTGLLGIHWRTKIMQLNVSALASAGWDQSWKPEVLVKETQSVAGPVGGGIVTFTEPVAETDEDTVYQSVRFDVKAYNLVIPNGTYTVTLKFNEPHYQKSGARKFGAKIQGKQVISDLDIFEKVGQNKALDYKFEGIRVDDGWMKIDFVYLIEFPCIAGIVIEGMTDGVNQIPGAQYTRKINCGGPAYKDYEADTEPGSSPPGGRGRTTPVADFYIDYARANFGDSVAVKAGRVFARIDGVKMPEPVSWGNGPGVIRVIDTPWEKELKRYWFVSELEKIRKDVRGAGNLERFDYWLNTYRYMRSMAQFGCTAGELNRIMAEVSAMTDPAAQSSLIHTRALPIRKQMAELWAEMISYQVAAVGTPGEMGTIANLEQQSRKANRLVNKHDAAIEKITGYALPADYQPSNEYKGSARIIVPTVRSLMNPGEELKLKVMIIGDTGGDSLPTGALYWRPMGKGEYSKIPLWHVGRRVYQVGLPILPEDVHAIEYYIEAECGGTRLVYPATAPETNQVVLISAVQP
ncbi:MAG: malectin domain-containing carbohydrate-binding protein [Armatimonadota bacterium]